MKDEIKVNKANKSITFINNGIAFSQFGVADEILDYITNLQNQLEEKTYLYNKLDTESKYAITNLQEENEMLNKECDTYMKISTKKQQRIDKAIEYIKNNWYELNTRDIEHCINLNKDIRIDLLNILQGSE